MAGKGIATWVKVKTKTGFTARPISHKYEGGASFESGQVITMSEYQKLKSEGNKAREEAAVGSVIMSKPIAVIPSVIKDAPRITSAVLLGSLTGEESPKTVMEEQKKREKLDNLIDRLENGRFKTSWEDLLNGDRAASGKEHALDALRDARNPRVGLIGVKNSYNESVGYLSYKTGAASISIQHLGTDQTQKGAGKMLFNKLLFLAAKEGKGIDVASEEDASAFYEKMGMKGNTGNHYMSADDVRRLAKR